MPVMDVWACLDKIVGYVIAISKTNMSAPYDVRYNYFIRTDSLYIFYSDFDFLCAFIVYNIIYILGTLYVMYYKQHTFNEYCKFIV